MNAFDKLGFYPADILLPHDIDMTRWAVVACDQFTSQPEYWQAVEETAGEAPSALRLILPESRLSQANVEDEIARINAAMKDYLSRDLFRTYEDALFYIERTQSDGKIRHGLVGKIDLEAYEFVPGNRALIRATEGTVLDRIPPRVKVRQDAPIELPHVMVLIDDEEKTVIEPLTAAAGSMEQIYDFELMQGGGRIRAFRLSEAQKLAVAEGLRRLSTAEQMEKKYGMGTAAPLVFAVGDGNHSLATAKRCYENQKAVTPAEKWDSLPSRYALVELVNNHDDALGFEPIHRVLFGIEPEKVLAALKACYPEAYEGEGEGHVLRYLYAGKKGAITVPSPKLQLAVGTLQTFLDDYVAENGCTIDYIHDDDVVEDLGTRPGNMGFLLPPMLKSELFKTVMADGVLPRKTFSMGHARDKRYYIEARKIR